MVMTSLLAIIVLLSVLFGAANGTLDAVSAAALSGAGEAVTLCLQLCGIVCLWTGILEVMERSGLASGLSRLFAPLLRRLIPDAANDDAVLSAVSANFSANLLGLGNAATPFGIQAAKRMALHCPRHSASDSLCRLIVLNTASIQLIPSTVSGIRASCGAAHPFDILPAVWLTSALSVSAGLLASRVMQHFWSRA